MSGNGLVSEWVIGRRFAPANNPFWQNRLALITGASSGIGAACAQRLGRAGLRVLLVARRRERLEQVADQIRLHGGQAEILTADLSQDTERQRVYNQVCEQHGGIDVLVNNAGLGWYGFGAQMPWETALELLQVNIHATVHFTLLFLQRMKERGFGRIINIGSVSGGLPSQGIAVYGATKSFLDNFTTALYRELAGSPVKISVVRAGPVHSEFCDTAAERPGGLHLPTERMGVTSEAVAERVWGLLRRPRRTAYIPRILAFTPWVEAGFGWLIDRLGPLLLNKHK